MATTDNNPKRYPFPRSLARSMRRAQGLPSRIPLQGKPAKVSDRMEVTKPLAVTVREKLRTAFQAVRRLFKAPKGR